MKFNRFFWQTFVTYSILAIVAAISFTLASYFLQTDFQMISFSVFVTLMMGIYLAFRVSRPLERLKLQVEKVLAGEAGDFDALSRDETLEIKDIAMLMDGISKELRDQIDLVARQRDEQEAVFVSMDEGVFALDLNRKITHYNPAAEEIFKIKREEALGKDLDFIVKNPDLLRICNLGIEMGQPIRTDIYLGADKNLKWIEVHLSPLRGKNGKRVGLVVVVSDVTRMRELEGMRKNFVANVSHELRTPLTSIQGFAETLMSPSLTTLDEARKFIEIIQRHAVRLGRIIEDILTLSRIERDVESSEIELKTEDLKEVCQSVVELCLVKASKKRIIISWQCSNGIQVQLDRYLFEQALVNLIDNAIRYSGDGTAIDLVVSANPDFINIMVRDQGSGIPEKHLSRIFERFYRVDQARSREAGGTGLGLAIVKHIVQAHGGKISVSSKMGEGTQFNITLPAGI
jgi:two-component system phosphate regulon sensor histidine kinase PhoR